MKKTFVAAVLLAVGFLFLNPIQNQLDAAGKAQRVKVEFVGGHETVKVDRGRPVVLIAGALGVRPEVFRNAFSRVRPAPQGQRPTREREMQNKRVLLDALSRYGITNRQLDAVSNYYRYNPGRGEMWPTRPAVAYAYIEDGVITRFEIKDGGSGYSSVPQLKVSGKFVRDAEIQLSYTKQFKTNGSINAILR